MLPGCSTAFILITARLVPELLDPVNKERRGIRHRRREGVVRGGNKGKEKIVENKPLLHCDKLPQGVSAAVSARTE